MADVFDSNVFDSNVFDTVAAGVAATAAFSASGTTTAYAGFAHKFDPEERHFFTDEFTQATFGDLFPGDGSGWWGYLDEPPSGSGGTSSVTPNGNAIVCDAPYVSGFTAKASIQKGGYSLTQPFRLFQGDTIDVVMEAKITSASAEDATILDFEAPPELYETSPGLRIYVNGGLVALEFAKLGLTNVDGTIAVPIGRVFVLRCKMFLSMRTDGRTQIWIDGELALDHTGINMPEIATFAGYGVTIAQPIYYDVIEMGATANGFTSPTVTVVLERTEFREFCQPKGRRGFFGHGKGVWG